MIIKAISLAAATLAAIVIVCSFAGCVPVQPYGGPVNYSTHLMTLPGTTRPQPPPQRQPNHPGNGAQIIYLNQP